jgi:prepilin-type N-terminal cleavage/methylation domain-containing protein
MMHASASRPGKSRAGFTLLEVLLAMAISVLLLVALYAALTTQFKHAQAGRRRIEQGTLARSLLSRIDADITGAVALSDPARFRLANSQNNNNNSGSGGGMSGGSGASGGTAGGASGGAAGGTANAGTTGGSATGNSSAGGSSSASGSSSSSNAPAAGNNVITLPLGVMGDSSTLNLFVSRVPSEVWGTQQGNAGILTSDLRRISYWMASGSGGLARAEAKLITSTDVTNNNLPTGEDETKSIIAPEVRDLTFSYYDGTSWQDTWDSTTMGADGITPIGAPRAIAITIDLATPGPRGKKTTKTFRHVVAIATANGATPQPQQTGNPGGGN